MVTMNNTLPLLIFILICLFCCLWFAEAESEAWDSSLVVKKDGRRMILETEFGEISAVEIGDGARSYHLQFFKLEPKALLLPVMLHSEMLLYCHSGNGDLTWIGHGKKSTTVSLARGDFYRLRQGSVFFIRSHLGTEMRERLRITVLFANSNADLHSPLSPMGPYSSIADLVRGFDGSVLQAAFQVPEEVIQTIQSAAKQPLIIQDVSRHPEGHSLDWGGRFMRVFHSIEGVKTENKKKHKESRTFNMYSAERDFENCNGWSLTVTSKDLEALKDSEFGAFYVNLTKGAMMAPHWNPMAAEIAFVVAGQGMVRIICSSSVGNQSGCENQSFKVEEGDVFIVPRFHPMSQTSFNNDSFVFMGFSTAGKKNYPQYLIGKQSVFQVIDRDVLAAAFNVDNETVVRLSGQQEEALIVECTSCAEEQFSAWQEEVRRKREEEEARKREEEDEKRREEEEEAKRREKEEKRREEEEEARERERKRQEEETARKEEERRQREEQAQREEEERKQREEEARRQEEERAEQERRQREEEAKRQEEQRKEEEREEQERRQREEEARRQEERRQREEEARRQEEERRQREAEEGRGGGGGEEEESEEEAARRQEEEREKREWEEQHGRGGGGSHGGGEEGATRAPEKRQTRRHRERERHQPQEEAERGGEQGESEGEAAMRQEEERIRREREQMERGRSVEPSIILVDNLDKVVDLLF